MQVKLPYLICRLSAYVCDLYRRHDLQPRSGFAPKNSNPFWPEHAPKPPKVERPLNEQQQPTDLLSV
jgi:hypothetical protein